MTNTVTRLTVDYINEDDDDDDNDDNDDDDDNNDDDNDDDDDKKTFRIWKRGENHIDGVVQSRWWRK